LQVTVFYSWQSDLPNPTNRGFIERALKDAAKTLRNDDSIRVEPVVDRDTLGVPGSPEIHRTIFEKIDAAAVFVADVSIINPNVPEGRRMPNPNVLVELGYALKSLGPTRIVLVMNTAFGPPEQLPFDLRTRRVLRYGSAMEDTERARARGVLATHFEGALRPILEEIERTPIGEPTTVRFKGALFDDARPIEVAELLTGEANRVRAMLDGENLLTDWSAQELHARVNRYEDTSADLVRMFALAGRWAPPLHKSLWRPALERVANPAPVISFVEDWEMLRRYPALRVLYAGGVAAVAAEKWDFLKCILIDVKVRMRDHLFPAVFVLHAPGTFNDGEQQLPGRSPAPLADRLAQTLRESLRDQFPGEDEYDAALDRFEAFLALVHADDRPDHMSGWCPLGRLAYRSRNVFVTIQEESKAAGSNWPPLRAGLFDGDLERFNKAFGRVREFARQYGRY